MGEERTLIIGEADWKRLLRYSPTLKFFRDDLVSFAEEIKAIENIQVELEYDKATKKLVARANKHLTPFQRLIVGAKISEEITGGNPVNLVDASGKELIWEETNWKALKKLPEKVLPPLQENELKEIRKSLAYVKKSTQLTKRSEEILEKFKDKLIVFDEKLHGKIPTAEDIIKHISKGEKYGIDLLKEAEKIRETLAKRGAPPSSLKIFDEAIEILRKLGVSPETAEQVRENMQKVVEEINKVSPKAGEVAKKLLKNWWGGIIVGASIGGYLLYNFLFGDKEPEEKEKEKEKKELDFKIPDFMDLAQVKNEYRKWANFYARASAHAENQYMQEIREAQFQIALAQYYHQFAYNQYLASLNPDPVEVAKINTYVNIIAGLSENERLKLQKDLLKGHILAQVRGLKFADPQQYLAFADASLPDLESQIDQYIKEVDNFLKLRLKPIEKKLAMYNDLAKYFFKKSVDYAVQIENPANLYNFAVFQGQEIRKKLSEKIKNAEEIESYIKDPSLISDKETLKAIKDKMKIWRGEPVMIVEEEEEVKKEEEEKKEEQEKEESFIKKGIRKGVQKVKKFIEDIRGKEETEEEKEQERKEVK
jgi:hypothetical protein